jgi:hypothetical protein
MAQCGCSATGSVEIGLTTDVFGPRPQYASFETAYNSFMCRRLGISLLFGWPKWSLTSFAFHFNLPLPLRSAPHFYNVYACSGQNNGVYFLLIHHLTILHKLVEDGKCALPLFVALLCGSSHYQIEARCVGMSLSLLFLHASLPF